MNGAERRRPEGVSALTEPNVQDGRGAQNTGGAKAVWSAQYVRIEIDDATPKVATIRIDRPKLNPLDSRVQVELKQAAEQVTARADVRAVVLYGGQVAFAAGADIKEMVDLSYTD